MTTEEKARAYAKKYVAEVYGGDTDFMDEAEDVISWLLRTHCIVENSKVMEEYQRAKDMNQNGIDLKIPVLCTFGSSKKVLLESLFAPDTFNETDK